MTVTEDITAAEPGRELVITLDQLRPTDRARVGGKALNLALMLQAGLPVPRGFCVTTAAFREWLAGDSGISTALAGLDRVSIGEASALLAQAASVRGELERLPVPDGVRRAVQSACTQCAEVKSWAVRSSATTEDAANDSFAGQHDSFLGIEGPEAVLTAVRRCWVSLFTDRAALYRAKRQQHGTRPAMAVVVQAMVNAELAGVVFSRDPVQPRADHLIIEGAPGGAEAVVAGQVTPARVVLDRQSLKLAQQSPAADAPPLTPSLSPAIAVRLAGLALEVERLFGTPQDVEWAAQNGSLHLLQARPITTLAPRQPKPPEVWCNANVCENLPGVLTPMSWSLVRLLLVGCFRPILRLIAIDTDVRPWIGLIAGRVYLNVGTTDEILRRAILPEPVRVWDLLGGSPSPEQEAALEALRRQTQPLTWRRRLALVVPVLRALPAAGEKSATAFLRTLRQRMDALARTPLAKLSDAELADFIPGIVSRLFPELESRVKLVRVIIGFGTGLACALGVRVATRRWLEDHEGRIAQRLLGAAGDMASAAAGLELWQLAAWARERAQLRSLIEAGVPFAVLREQLRGSVEGDAFLERWDEFMRRHGHHTRGEVDVFNARWSEKPDEILEWVRHYLQLPDGFDSLKAQDQRQQASDALLEDSCRRLRNPIRRGLLRYLVQRARRGLAYRENVKNEAVRSIARLRASLIEAGRRLASRGVLAGVEDVFFLEIGEVKAALSGDRRSDLGGVVSARKLARQRLEALDPPSIVVGALVAAPKADHPGPEIAEPGLELRGLGVSPGVVAGPARVVTDDGLPVRVQPGEILVLRCTDPGCTPLFLTAAGVVADIGGQLSHGSIIAREYGIPAVVNARDATRSIRTGQRIEVDGDRGTVRVLG